MNRFRCVQVRGCVEAGKARRREHVLERAVLYATLRQMLAVSCSSRHASVVAVVQHYVRNGTLSAADVSADH